MKGKKNALEKKIMNMQFTQLAKQTKHIKN